MTTDITIATNGHKPSTDKSKPAPGAKQLKPKAAPQRATKRAAASAAAESGYSAAASRLLSQGRQAAGGAYEWVAEEAGRALPLAARYMPDQRTVQRIADERPYVLGAIGLGIGAIIGLMLPARLTGGAAPAPARPAKRASRKR